MTAHIFHMGRVVTGQAHVSVSGLILAACSAQPVRNFFQTLFYHQILTLLSCYSRNCQRISQLFFCIMQVVSCSPVQFPVLCWSLAHGVVFCCFLFLLSCTFLIVNISVEMVVGKNPDSLPKHISFSTRFPLLSLHLDFAVKLLF